MRHFDRGPSLATPLPVTPFGEYFALLRHLNFLKTLAPKMRFGERPEPRPATVRTRGAHDVPRAPLCLMVLPKSEQLNQRVLQTN